MPHIRFMIDLAVPFPLTPILHRRIDAIIRQIGHIRQFAVKINEGAEDEEDTTQAAWHLCLHAEHQPCDKPNPIPPVPIEAEPIDLEEPPGA